MPQPAVGVELDHGGAGRTGRGGAGLVLGTRLLLNKRELSDVAWVI